MNIVSALENTVPISVFNRGLAGKIFSEVKQSGAKVVIKNNVPECVLLSPQDYLDLMEEVENARLLSLADRRLQNYEPAAASTLDEVKAKFGITDEELAQIDEAEIE